MNSVRENEGNLAGHKKEAKAAQKFLSNFSISRHTRGHPSCKIAVFAEEAGPGVRG
jgi:hypothetical protein